MNLANLSNSYELLDSGLGEKLEKFGKLLLTRPCAQAVWNPSLSKEIWKKADMHFTRKGGNAWTKKEEQKGKWTVCLAGIEFQIEPTDFGHLGIFPEHASQWEFLEKQIRKAKKNPEVLNLFAYTGGATFFCAKAGAKVCHLDASKASVAWAKKNAILNRLQDHPIRWIVDDVLKFLKREIKRGHHYDGIILDPPSFGRGSQGEVFKIERDLGDILSACKELLSKDPLFVLFTSHTSGFTPLTLHHLLRQIFSDGEIDYGEMTIACKSGFDLPSGCFARWAKKL